MLANLPEDQQALILRRLGKTKAEEIAAEATSVTSFYNLCIREMGSARGGERSARIPNKTMAWIEVMSKKKETAPSFSHPLIERTIESFGGWTNMIEEFRGLDIPKAKYRFQFAYEDVLNA